MTLNEQVLQELSELKRIGVHIKNRTFELAKTSDLSEYENMSVSEIADLLIMLT